MGKRILITGGAGFVGSNLAVYFKNKFKGCKVICLDNLIRPGSEINARRIKKEGIDFIKGDIRRKKDLLELSSIDFIIECSAEPSVLAAFDNPSYTIDTNLMGTINCLELAKREKAGFIFLSTSRVYPIERLNEIGFEEHETRFDYLKGVKGDGYSYAGINENFPLLGARSLYGATKLSSEHLITEYIDMFGLRAVINRLGVIAGPWQMGKIDQGLLGYWMAKHVFGGELKYFGYNGSGKQLRDVVHVADVCDLIYEQVRRINELNGEIFNVGGGRGNSFSLVELTGLTRAMTNKTIHVQPVRKMRRADVRHYITDNSYVTKVTGWKPKRDLNDICKDVHEWIKDNNGILKKVLS